MGFEPGRNHHHIYERTDPIKAGAATATAPIGATITPATEGTTYVAAGGAGKSLYAFNAPDSDEGAVDNAASVAGYVNETGSTEVPETVTWSRVRYTGCGLLVVTVSPSAWGKPPCWFRAINENGTDVDRFTLIRWLRGLQRRRLFHAVVSENSEIDPESLIHWSRVSSAELYALQTREDATQNA
jgi:hypothetical protein